MMLACEAMAPCRRDHKVCAYMCRSSIVLLEHPLTTTKDTTVNARRRSNLCLPHITCESQTQVFRLHLRARLFLAQPLSTTLWTPGSTRGAGRTFASRTSPTSQQTRDFSENHRLANTSKLMSTQATGRSFAYRTPSTNTECFRQPQAHRRQHSQREAQVEPLPTITSASQKKIVSGSHRLGEGRTCAYSHHLLLTLP